MRVLLTGANGFIGAQVLAGLRARGHTVVAAVRDPEALRRKWPGIETLSIDFNRDLSVEVWRERMVGIDAVINCAGVLHGGQRQDIEAIHAEAPIALFDACRQAGVSKVVQVSAISADEKIGTPYALTKKRADDHLRGLDLHWTVLRPSLVYGDGSYGGTSTIRGLAGLPFFTPLVGNDAAAFRPIHVSDLVETVVRVLDDDRLARTTLEPVGPETLSLGEIVAKYRAWLGLRPARGIAIPVFVAKAVARVADLSGGGPMGSAGLRQFLAGNAGHEPAGVFQHAIGFTPASMEQRLSERPAQTQDLWHARLYFLQALLRLSLAILWFGSAIAGFLAPVETYGPVAEALAAIGLPPRPLAVGFSVVDLAIAAALVARVRPRLLAVVQAVVVVGYTLGLSLLDPPLWLDPFGGLLKNVPILAAIAVWAVLEKER
jgi:uncharacterized protein YbjT (DUF2867 family)